MHRSRLGGLMSDFSELVDGFLRNEFETSPVTATMHGVTEYDEKLDDLSATAFLRRDSDAAAWLKRFEAAESDLGADDEIDRQLAIAMLRGRLIHADWEIWKRDPTAYSSPILNGL